jgi:hypothetical protein
MFEGSDMVRLRRSYNPVHQFDLVLNSSIPGH